MRRASSQSGFSLIELAIVVLVLGLTIAIGVGGFHRYSADQQLRDSARSVAGQVTLARSLAMSTATTRTVNFDASSSPQSVRILGTSSRSWTLPREIHYATGSATTVNMTSDGRASASSYIVLQNNQGLRDTVSIESSGLVIAR